MRFILTIFLFALCFQSKAQIPAGFVLDSTLARSSIYQTYALVSLPDGYNFTGNKRYPLLLWLHGAGEGGGGSTMNTSSKGNLSRLSLITGANSPARLVSLGWKKDAVNPKTGVRDTFLVIAPQCITNWSYSYNELRFMIPDIISKYRIDTTRIYMTGLSAGGAGITTCLGSRDSLFINRIAAAVTFISAGVNAASGPAGSYNTTQVVDNIYLAPSYGVRVWKIAGENDSWLNSDLSYHNKLNQTLPTPRNKFTVYAGVGHTSAARFFDTAARPVTNYYGNTGACNSGCAFGGVPPQANNNGSTVRGSGVTQDSLNVYEWLLSNQRGVPNTPVPTAVAGTDQTIALPLDSVTVDGTGSAAGTGATMTSYVWTQRMGTPATIVTPNASITKIRNLLRGRYIFELRVTNNIGISHSDFIVINVTSTAGYNNPTVSLVTSATQNITTSTATITLSYTLTGASLREIKWQKLKVPGQTGKKVVGIGSSSLAGANATVLDSALIGRFTKFCTDNGLTSSITSYALSGMSVFAAMPTSQPYAGQDAVDTARNITKALKQNPDIVLVWYGSNDYDATTAIEPLTAFRIIYDSIVAVGKQPILFTAQPRPAFGSSAQLRLLEISDSVLTNTRYTGNTVNAQHPITADDGITPLYGDADGIHQTNAGHRAIIGNLIKANPFKSWATSASVITSPNSASTTVTGLANGEHKFLGTVTDSKGQTFWVVTTINVSTVSNNPPNADAGTDIAVSLPTSQATISATGSTDGDGTITTYAWTKISGPTGGTITSSSSATTTVTALQEGTYQFRVLVTDDDGATDADTVAVVVSPDPLACSNVRYDAPNIGYYYNSIDLRPGDTLDLNNYTYQYVYIANRNGTATCPIVIMNSGGRAIITAPGINPGNPAQFYGDGSQLKLENCTFIKVTGSGSADQYGIKVQPYGTDTLRNGSHAVSIVGRSKNIEIEKVEVRNAGIGYNIKEDESCEPGLQYLSWIMDSIFIHDGKIRYTWNQGLYVGNTAPDNDSDAISPRPIVCEGVTVWPRPIRMGNIHVWNMDIDSTGRAGIQISAASNGTSLVYNNTVKHSGMSGDPGQGFGIVFGTYTRGKIYNNTVVNTYMYGIGSQGVNGPSNLEIYNNTIDSSGSLNHFNYSVWSPADSGQMIKISTRQVKPWDNGYTVYNIFLTTLANMDGETSGFTITGNTLGRKNKPENIGFNGALFRSTGNVICGNTNSLGGAVTATYEGPVVNWTDCQQRNFIIRTPRVSRLKFKRN